MKTAGYYLTQINKLMEDSQYDAELTCYLLQGVLRMARDDERIDVDDFYEISEVVSMERINLTLQIKGYKEG